MGNIRLKSPTVKTVVNGRGSPLSPNLQHLLQDERWEIYAPSSLRPISYQNEWISSLQHIQWQDAILRIFFWLTNDMGVGWKEEVFLREKEQRWEGWGQGEHELKGCGWRGAGEGGEAPRDDGAEYDRAVLTERRRLILFHVLAMKRQQGLTSSAGFLRSRGHVRCQGPVVCVPVRCLESAETLHGLMTATAQHLRFPLTVIHTRHTHLYLSDHL